MVTITRYLSFFFWLSHFSPEFTLDREPPSGPPTGGGGRWASAMPGKLQGSGAAELLRASMRPQPQNPHEPTPSSSVVQNPCFQHWLSPRPAHGARGSEFFSDTRATSVGKQYPQDGRSLGPCQALADKNILGFPGAAHLRSRNKAILAWPCTSSWLPTGPLGSWADRNQNPSQKRGVWALWPCGLGVPPEAPGTGVWAPPAPCAPLGRVPQWRGWSPLTTRMARAQTLADQALLKDSLLSGKAHLCRRRCLHQRWCQKKDSKRPSPGGNLDPELGLGLLVSSPAGQRGLRISFCSPSHCSSLGILACRSSNYVAEAFIYCFGFNIFLEQHLHFLLYVYFSK